MKFILVFVSALVSFSSLFAQSKIPTPPGFPNAECGGSCVIGDFDGDGSIDIYMTVEDYTGGHNYVMGIYSVKKAQYLFVESRPTESMSSYPTTPLFGDFNGDGRVELIIGNTLYSYGTTVSKKKA